MQPHIMTLAVALIWETSALTDVNAELLTPSGDGWHWPTGRSTLVVDAAEDAAINGLPAQPYDIIFTFKILSLLSRDLRVSIRISKTTRRCDAGQAILASEPSKEISIYQDRESGDILIDASAEKVLVPERNTHIVDGVEKDGVYL
jgi:hypothetical protein